MLLIDLLYKIPSSLYSIIGILMVVSVVWGHGYYTANSSWKTWYKEEQTRQVSINKKFYEQGIAAEKRLKQEEQDDENILKQNEQESENDPNRDSPALSRDSVQRLKRL